MGEIWNLYVMCCIFHIESWLKITLRREVRGEQHEVNTQARLENVSHIFSHAGPENNIISQFLKPPQPFAVMTSIKGKKYRDFFDNSLTNQHHIYCHNKIINVVVQPDVETVMMMAAIHRAMMERGDELTG